VNCSKLLISAGIERIIYDVAYPDPVASELLREAGVELISFAAATARHKA